MENRRMLLAMTVALGLFLLYTQFVLPIIYKKYNYDPNWQTKQAATTQSSAPAAGASTAPDGSAGSATKAVALAIAPPANPTSVTLGSTAKKDPAYRMGVQINPQGAGLESVTLNEFKMSVQGDDAYHFQHPYADAPVASRSLASRSITIDGIVTDLSNLQWSLDSSTADSATYSVMITDAGKLPLVKISKVYKLSGAKDPGLGYELGFVQTIENLTTRPLNVRASFNGPVLPPREQDRGAERQVLAGYTVKNYVEFTYNGIESLTKDKPTKEYTKDGNGNPLSWLGTCGIYFNAILRPLSLDSTATAATYIEHVTATLVNPTIEKPEDHEVSITFDTTELPVGVGSSVSFPFSTYLGPRQRDILNQPQFSAFPASYEKTLVLTSGPCSVCTFDWLIQILVKLLQGFHSITRDWGLAIICLVVLVRTCLHPITKRSQISMSKMGKMGPEMERLKKKFGDDKEGLNKAMMQMYKEQGVAPVLGCLPMFLQMPIWIALWQSLQTTFELRHAPFLWGFTWIHDLSKPDHFYTFAKPIPLFIFGWTLPAINILPLLLAIVFWIQAKMQPKPVAATPEQEQQQKMMQWMTLLFPLMLYTGPSGLNLYIMTSTAIGIVESKIVRDHIKQREEDEKAGRIIVDGGKKLKGGGAKKTDGKEPKKGGLMGMLADLQAKADQMTKDKDKRK